MVATAVVIEDPEVRRGLRGLLGRVETPLSLAAHDNWRVDESLAALQDALEAEWLELAGRLGREIEKTLAAAIGDGHVDAGERQEIAELLGELGRVTRELRQYDATENAQHDVALAATRESRGHLRDAIRPVTRSLDGLNHRRAGRGQPVELGITLGDEGRWQKRA